jgi:hypothetical protein
MIQKFSQYGPCIRVGCSGMIVKIEVPGHEPVYQCNVCKGCGR